MPLDLLTNLKSFIDAPCGGQWFRANLHVHAKGNTPDAIVEAAHKAGISLLAVTDHNSFAHVADVRSAAVKHSNGRLAVLSGIEITLHEGAHLIAIFDEDMTEDEQTSFLGAVGLPLDGSEKNVVKDHTCSEVLREISDRNGITLVPHPFTGAIGLLDSARKMPTRMDWLESGNLGLIQIPDDKVKYVGHDDSGTWQNRYILTSTPKKIIESTDYSFSPLPPGEAGKPDDIENGATWLKLGSLNANGLRQVTCEPRTRISQVPPTPPKRNRILGLTVTGGSFDGLQIPFASDLTCIFGENHSGKSAILDFISFAIARDAILVGEDRETERDTLFRRLNAILQSGSIVSLFLLRDGTAYCFTRLYAPTLDKDGKIAGIEHDPDIFRYDSDRHELVPEGYDGPSFLPEIYPQGHVGLLRRSAQTQLALIDDLAGLTTSRASREELRTRLHKNAEILTRLYETQEEQTGKVGRLASLKAQLADLEKSLAETNHDLWEASTPLTQGFRSKLETLKEALTGDCSATTIATCKMPEIVVDKEKMAESDLLESLATLSSGFNKKMEALYLQLATAVTELHNDATDILDKWDNAYARHSQELSRVLREKGFDSPEQHLQKIRHIKTEIQDILKMHQPALASTRTALAQTEKERYELLDAYRRACDEVQTDRTAMTTTLNDRLAPDIRVTFGKPDPSEYAALLGALCDQVSSKDHRISRREEQLGLIVGAVTPRQLAEAVVNNGSFRLDSKTTTTLASHCRITDNTQNVLCRLADKILALHELQVFEPDPVPQITVRREGMDKFADLLTQMSPGEQSSAILAIALMAREMPLLIDQPEDELGYSYIVNKIVPKILDAKTARQMIMISHNANIPVLGDAEWLMKVRNDPVEGQPKCSVERAGVFEDRRLTSHLLGLEGGERAFLIRQYRYAVPQRS